MAKKIAPVDVDTTAEAIEARLSSEIIVIPDALDPLQKELNAVLEAEAVSGSYDSRKPDISHLAAATVTDESGLVLPLFDVNDRIVIERHASMLDGRPWLDTQTYVVQSIDDETGDLRLWNPDLSQFALGNFRTGPARGDDYRLADGSGPVVGKRKRGRPRKRPVHLVAQQGEKKRGRGRPKGSKNRPKDVIKAEKAERASRASSKRKAKGGR
jgi:hypothetical protein